MQEKNFKKNPNWMDGEWKINTRVLFSYYCVQEIENKKKPMGLLLGSTVILPFSLVHVFQKKRKPSFKFLQSLIDDLWIVV